MHKLSRSSHSVLLNFTFDLNFESPIKSFDQHPCVFLNLNFKRMQPSVCAYERRLARESAPQRKERRKELRQWYIVRAMARVRHGAAHRIRFWSLTRSLTRDARLRACVRACVRSVGLDAGFKDSSWRQWCLCSRTAVAAAGTRYIHEGWNSRRLILFLFANFVTPP